MNWEQKQIALDRHRYPAFTPCLATVDGWTTEYKIRPNRVLVRPYQPKGLTPGGIYLERNEKWPPIFGHVLAVPWDCDHDIEPGDFVCYKHLTDNELYDEPYMNPIIPGERADVVILHVESIRFVFDPTPVEFRL